MSFVGAAAGFHKPGCLGRANLHKHCHPGMPKAVVFNCWCQQSALSLVFANTIKSAFCWLDQHLAFLT